MQPSDYTFTLAIQVRDYEVDVEGIVNNAEYLHYMEHTRHEFCKMAGLSFREMHARGLDPVVTRIEIDYKSSLTMGEEMISCLDVKRKGPLFVFEQHIFHADGRPAALGTVRIACLNNGALCRGDELAEAFGPYLK